MAGLALILGAVGAAALVALTSLAAPPPAACRGPSDAAVAFTRAAPSGAHVVGLTTFDDGAGAEVQFIGASELGPVSNPRAVLPGLQDVTLRKTATAGCYALGQALAGVPWIDVTAAAPNGGIDARIRLPRAAEQADRVVELARRVTLGLQGLDEVQRVARSDDDQRTRLAIAYDPSGYVVAPAGGRPTRYTSADWPGLFYWTIEGAFLSARVIGRERRGGRELVRVSGVVPLPLWLELLIDPETGFVHEQRMLASGHFMDSRFSGFRGG